MQDMTNPDVLYVDTHEGEPMQFESLCMECMENVSEWLLAHRTFGPCPIPFT